MLIVVDSTWHLYTLDWESILICIYIFSASTRFEKKVKTTKRDEKQSWLVCDASLLLGGTCKSLFSFCVPWTGPLYAEEAEGGKACNYIVEVDCRWPIS